MKETELGSEEYQKRIKKQEEYALEATRTDAEAEYRASRAADSGMYYCGKCRSKKVSVRFMQTRGADEPMTEFYTCMDCGK